VRLHETAKVMERIARRERSEAARPKRRFAPFN
jgi:hypothetical protein